MNVDTTAAAHPPTHPHPLPPPPKRSLLYKFFLVALGARLPLRLASAVALADRPASTASQTYTPGDAAWAPVGQPVPKLGALIQATGEALYTDDEVSAFCVFWVWIRGVCGGGGGEGMVG